MGFKEVLHSRVTAVVAGATALALAAGGAGYAAGQITSGDIKNDTIRSVDVHDDGLKLKDISDSAERQLQGERGPQGPQGEPGEPGPPGPPGTAEYAGPTWSIVDRNVIGNGDSYLRAGPGGEPPLGMGSLGIRTGSPTDKAAFGNEVDFVGDPLTDLTTVSYSVYTTGENNDLSPENGPSVTFEIDPTGPEDLAPNYSSLVYVPTALEENAWTELDASTADRWFLTGAAGTSSCNQTTYCTLDDVRTAFPNATLISAQITKGRDFAFSGAVDALTIGDTTYDFEQFGVSEAGD
jgi:hypothetical protein